MSEQIREQVSAFLDGELPSSETELLLKRLTRDAELRESFGRYALIGEAMRGPGGVKLSRGFAERLNAAIDGEGEKAPVVAAIEAAQPRWWKPFAGAAMVAGVAAVAVMALQQRAIAPGSHSVANNQVPATTVMPPAAMPVSRPASNPVQLASNSAPPASGEPVSYVTPPPSRLTNYVFAHSKYSTGLGRRGVLTDLLIEDDEVPVASHAAPPVPARAP